MGRPTGMNLSTDQQELFIRLMSEGRREAGVSHAAIAAHSLHLQGRRVSTKSISAEKQRLRAYASWGRPVSIQNANGYWELLLTAPTRAGGRLCDREPARSPWIAAIHRQSRSDPWSVPWCYLSWEIMPEESILAVLEPSQYELVAARLADDIRQSLRWKRTRTAIKRERAVRDAIIQTLRKRAPMWAYTWWHNESAKFQSRQLGGDVPATATPFDSEYATPRLAELGYRYPR